MDIEAGIEAVSDALATHSAAVLVAPPGLGKTTRVPLALLESEWLEGARILMTEPRRVATRAAARRIAQLAGSRLGGRVGYSVRGERRAGSSTRLEVMTERTLVRRVQRDPGLDGVGLVVFDEYHERNLDLDLAVALTLDAIRSLDLGTRVLVMSATIDADRIAGFLGGAPVVTCHSEAFPVETTYLPQNHHQPIHLRMAEAVGSVLGDANGSGPGGDLLAFLPGRAEIRRTRSALGGRGIDALVLTGGSNDESVEEVFHRPKNARGRVILATSVAESSITIPGVSMVLDSGLARVPAFDPGTAMGSLRTVRASKASVDQRRGRAGRTGPGRCYRMWSSESQRTRDDFPTPEILAADLSSLVLEVFSWGAGAPGDLPWIDAPPDHQWAQAAGLLERLGAIVDGRITAHGRRVLSMPVHPRLGHMVASAGEADRESAAVIACLIEDGTFGDLAIAVDAPSRGIWRDVERLMSAASNGGQTTGGGAGRKSAGALTATAFPDRLARRRRESGTHYLMANGVGLDAGRVGSLTGSDWIVAVSSQERDGVTVVQSGIALAAVDALAAGADAVQSRVDAVVDEVRGRVSVERIESLGSILLHSGPPAGDTSDEAIRECLLDGFIGLIGSGPVAMFGWDARSVRLIERLAYGTTIDSTLPGLEESDLRSLARDNAGLFVAARSTRASLEDIGVGTLASIAVDRAAMERLDRVAPESVDLGNGTRRTVSYRDAQPRVATRLQDVLGVTRHPAIPGTGCPVVLDLLSPASRSIQITSDLEGFWAGSYAEVRKEMRGRYPKHAWPEDPTERPKPRAARRR